jgi:hypothetical protein
VIKQVEKGTTYPHLEGSSLESHRSYLQKTSEHIED